MFGSSESWELQQRPRLWHSRAGGGAVHSIKSGLMHRSKDRIFDQPFSVLIAAVGRGEAHATSRKTPVVGMCDEPAHDLGAFFDRAESTGTSLVASGHIGLEQEVMRICLCRP
jgi:hypothetical protein